MDWRRGSLSSLERSNSGLEGEVVVSGGRIVVATSERTRARRVGDWKISRRDQLMAGMELPIILRLT